MDKTPYPVGTVCRIRSIENMKAEFGSLSNIPFGFNSEMEYMCGETFTVKQSRRAHSVHGGPTFRYYSEECIEETRPFGEWYISHEMLEPIIQNNEEEPGNIPDKNALYSFLFG